MDKNAIKKYAVWARQEMIDRVRHKAAQYGITDSAIIPADAISIDGVLLSPVVVEQRKALIQQINVKGYQEVIEEVAYTWFNRFIALRFMEVNGYLPSRVRVFTDAENGFHPQILAEAIDLELDGLDMEKVYALKNANEEEALYKYLLITQCNALNPILPGMFQKIADYTELLLPDNLLRDGSVIQRMIEWIPEKDWQDQVQIIGWLYQYYNSEKKDNVFAALKKNVKITKENIPAATQLFTPDWIVRYMVENSLGRLWVEGHPNDELKANWKYYLEEAEQEPDVQIQLAEIRKEYAQLKPQDIKVIDPCCGSGHILVYMFDVLMQIYQSYGYTQREAARSIVAHNLYGLDIDERAAQLSYFAVMMKARQYDRKFLRYEDEDGNLHVLQPNVYAICESNDIRRGALKYFGCSMSDMERNLAIEQINDLLDAMQDAKEYGSILTIKDYNWELLYRFVSTVDFDGQLDFDAGNLEETKEKLWRLVEIAAMLAQKYDVVVTNPPYMNVNGMNGKLGEFIKKNYPETKSDLSTVFMEKAFSICTSNGYMAMINIPVWMFITSYTGLRENIIQSKSIANLLHLGRGIFGSDFGTTAFVIQNTEIRHKQSKFYKLYFRQGEVNSVEEKEKMFFDRVGEYISSQDFFDIIPDSPIAYWASKELLNDFNQGKSASEYASPKQGMSTCDVNRFTRYWFEVVSYDTNIFDKTNIKKWIRYNKGGNFRKWYGNREYVVYWGENGDSLSSNGALLRNRDVYFQPFLAWTKISSAGTGFRKFEDYFLFDGAGGSLFNKNCGIESNYLLGMLNSKVNTLILNLISPTLNFNENHIGSIPILKCEDQKVIENISNIVNHAADLSKLDWDAFETSWDFQIHPLLQYAALTPQRVAQEEENGYLPMNGIADAYRHWEQACDDRFYQLKANEEELNRIFIDIYGLQDELTPEVGEKDVTVRKADLTRDVKSLISYAVGCMFGRYSLNRQGLVYAGGDWEQTYHRNVLVDEGGNAISFGGNRITVDKNYQINVDGQWQDCTYSPEADNIIPICDDEYFEDDIVGRFVTFIETVYGKNTLEENLKFIANALGGKGQPRDVIRSYFLNDFFNDHCKIYQKRPIYWQFDSGKKNGFKALIYLHRYQPDTIARIRTDYVHEQQSRYRTAIAGLEQRIAGAATAERVKLTKQLKKLQDQAEELHGYEEKIHHLADQMIAIDLDDGVKKNYEIFQDVLAKIK